MTIQLLFFGITTDLVGAPAVNIDIAEQTTIGALKKLLKQQYDGLNNIYDFAVALNEEYAHDDWVLTDGDTVAIIPPVSGG